MAEMESFTRKERRDSFPGTHPLTALISPLRTLLQNIFFSLRKTSSINHGFQTSCCVGSELPAQLLFVDAGRAATDATFGSC